MDILDDILDTLDLKGSLYFRTDFSPPWSVTVPPLGNAARFHLVMQGTCHVKVADETVVTLGPGDMILIPKGASHILSDKPVLIAPPLESVLADTGYTGEGVLAVGQGNPSASTQMVCGHFSFRPGAAHPLLEALPDYYVTTNSTRAKQPLIDESLRLIARRIFSESLGSEAAVKRLSEIVFIEVLRTGIIQDQRFTHMLDAFKDFRIGKALHLVHSRLAHPWTVDMLAREVAMSRSRFADRFKDLLGMGPMAYLAEWRLQKALSLLQDNRLSMQQIAGQIGYQSPAAFTRAFNAKFAISPTDYRKQYL